MSDAALPPAWSRISAAAQAALSLVLPVWCAGCDAPDLPLCGSCRAALAPRPERRTVGGIPVWAGLAFRDIPARVIRAFKEDGRTGLAPVLAGALSAAAAEALRGAGSGSVLAVPMPTSAAAMRRRGFRPVELVAARAGLHPRRVLVSAGRRRDQRGLDVAAREQNVAGGMRVPPRRLALIEGRAVLLLDDVVTTGATLAEAARTLERAGATIIGAATVASTPRTHGYP